jgi:hypothetical protein
LFPLLATCVSDTDGKFAAGVVDTGGKLPPVSLTWAANLQPGYKKHLRNWWHNLSPLSLTPVAILTPMSLTPVANLPPVSLIPVVHLDLRISPQIFEKKLKLS